MHTHTHTYMYTYRGVEIVSQLPNILTYFHHSCPDPHILCIQLSFRHSLGMNGQCPAWLVVSKHYTSTHISLFYYMCVHSHSLHHLYPQSHAHISSHSSSVHTFYVPSYHSHIFTHFLLSSHLLTTTFLQTSFIHYPLIHSHILTTSPSYPHLHDLIFTLFAHSNTVKHSFYSLPTYQ